MLDVLPLLSPAAGRGWLVQIITFLVATIATCSAATAAGVCFVRTRKWHRAYEVLAAVAAGAFAAVGFGMFGLQHFGALELPYVGGGLLMTSTGTALWITAISYARAERPQLPYRWLALASLLPLFVVSVGTLLVHQLFPSFSFDLDYMREVISRMGVLPLGALIGAGVGALGGLWFSTTSLFARSRVSCRDPLT